MSPPLVLIALIIICLCLIYMYITKEYDYWKNKNISHSQPNFPFGNFQRVFLGRESVGRFLQNIYNSHKTDLAGFFVFGKPHLLLRSPEIIKNVLIKDFKKFDDRNIFVDHSIDPIGTKTLFILPNPEWKATRVKVTPFFTTSKMKSMITLIETSCKDLVLFLRKTEVVDAKEVSAQYTTDVISNCAFGVKSFCFEDEHSPFRLVGKRMFGVTFMNGLRLVSYFLMPAFVKLFRLPVYDKKCTDFLKDVFWKAIEEREHMRNRRNDLIDIIINLKNQDVIGDGLIFEGDTVVAQALQFYIAGFETTSSSLSMILYQLCLNPQIQNKLREELANEKKKSGSLCFENLMRLEYMGMVISESLRMCPPLPFLDRRCNEDYTIPDTNVIIEKGTPIFISMLGLHYDAEFYPNPEIFDPERFTEEKIAKRPTYAYVPFGHGPRNCIGERFGLMAIKMCLASILQNFEILKTEDTPGKIVFNSFTILLQPVHDLPMRFKPIM